MGWGGVGGRSLILLAVVTKDEVLELVLHLDPLLGCERGPDMMRLGDCGLVGFQGHLRLVIIHMQRAQDEDESRERGVGANRLQPIIVEVKQHHLRLCGLEDEVTELLHLQAGLEWQLQLRALRNKQTHPASAFSLATSGVNQSDL